MMCYFCASNTSKTGLSEAVSSCALPRGTRNGVTKFGPQILSWELIKSFVNNSNKQDLVRHLSILCIARFYANPGGMVLVILLQKLWRIWCLDELCRIKKVKNCPDFTYPEISVPQSRVPQKDLLSEVSGEIGIFIYNTSHPRNMFLQSCW